MQKRLLATILAVSLLVIHAESTALAFTDIDSNSTFGKSVAYLESHNILKGNPDGTVRVHDPLTRVEALVTILRANEKFAQPMMWFSENVPDIPLFSDVVYPSWYAASIEVGFLEDVITGFADGTFRPSDQLTIEQALIMLQRALDNDRTEHRFASGTLQNIPDQWFTDAVSEANNRNLLGQQYSLGQKLTRGQFFDIVYRLHSIEASNQIVFKEPEGTSIAVSQPANLPAFQPLPLTISPNPFSPSDPFVLNLPPPGKSSNGFEQNAVDHEFGSDKFFAISIPSLDLYDIAINHPDNPFEKDSMLGVLKEGLGHLFAYPGNSGKVMIYGHSSSYPWDLSEFTKIFRQVNRTNPGDRIYITYDNRLYIYEVTEHTVIDATDVSPFNDDGTSELILYTCWPPDSIKQRYLVHAVPVETVALR